MGKPRALARGSAVCCARVKPLSGRGTYTRTALSASVTATRLPAGFAGLDQPDARMPPRGAARPDRVDRGVDTLPGVGPSLRGKLAKLGIRTIRDLLEYAPRDYQRPLGETPIAALRPETEAAVAGAIRSASTEPRRRRALRGA